MRNFILTLVLTISIQSNAENQSCLQICENPNHPFCTDTGSIAFRAYLPFSEMLATIPDSGFSSATNSTCNRTSSVTGNSLQNVGDDCDIVLNNVPVFNVQIKLTGAYEGTISDDFTPKGSKVKKIFFSKEKLPSSLIIWRDTGETHLDYGTAIAEVSFNERGMVLSTNNPENCFFIKNSYLGR